MMAGFSMDNLTLFDFRITNGQPSFEPRTFPMARLARYLDKLSNLLGYTEHVHLLTVNKGSVMPIIAIDTLVEDKVIGRLKEVNSPEIQKIRKEINKMLLEDNATASFKFHKAGGVIMHFEGIKAPICETITVYEHGELEGTIIRIGGKDDSVPVWLKAADGVIYKCNTSNKTTARELAGFLFGDIVRVSGKAIWLRTQMGVWELERFTIQSFEHLAQEPISQIIERLRHIDGNGWNELDNPQQTWKELRGGE